jgi:hypothetical protein
MMNKGFYQAHSAGIAAGLGAVKWLCAPLIGVATLLGAPVASQAAAYDLTQDFCSRGCSPSPYGTVTVTQDGADGLAVTVSLSGGNQFHDTNDSQHHALMFDLANSSITISGLPSPFTGNGSQGNASGGVDSDGSGSWDFVLNYPHHSGGPAGITSYSFDIMATSALSPTSFLTNSNGLYFATDILAFNGSTGNVGSNSFTTVPEPATWAMMLLGFAGLGYAGYRKAKTGAGPIAA